MQFDVESMIPKLFMSHTEHKHWMPHTQSAKNKWFVTLNWAVSIASMDKIRFEGKIRGHFVKSFGLHRFRFAWYVDAHKQTAAKVECDNQNGNRLVLSVMSLTVCLTFFWCVCTDADACCSCSCMWLSFWIVARNVALTTDTTKYNDDGAVA